MKLAVTLDGRLAARDGSSRWITSEETRRVVHARRLGADAVLVGSGTIMTDDPSLTVREMEAPRQPLALVLDSRGRVSGDARIFARGDVVMVTTVSCPHSKQLEWKEAGAEVLVLPASEGRVDVDALITEAGRRGLLEIFCEGGATVATELLRRQLVDRLDLHVGPKMVGAGGTTLGDLGVPTMSSAIGFQLVEAHISGDDLVATYTRRT